MMDTETCTICRSNSRHCECQPRVTEFLRILLKTDRNVSRSQITSKHVGPELGKGCIDKLNFYLPEGIPRQLLESRLSNIGLNYRAQTLKDKKWHIVVGNGLHFYLGHPDQSLIRKIVTRPSAHKNWQEYILQVEHLFDGFLDQTIISRIDLAVDYKVPFSTTLESLNVKYKRKRVEYEERSGVKTGIKIGTGNSKIIAYNKALEQGISSPLSRIEIQLQGKSVPVKGLRQLPQFLLDEQFCPFKHIQLNEVKTNTIPGYHSKEIVDRMTEFQILLKHTGYYGARKAVNKDRNFDRDIKPFTVIEPWTLSADKVLRDSLITFFSERRKES